jgi:hypothetical protein
VDTSPHRPRWSTPRQRSRPYLFEQPGASIAGGHAKRRLIESSSSADGCAENTDHFDAECRSWADILPGDSDQPVMVVMRASVLACQ